MDNLMCEHLHSHIEDNDRVRRSANQTVRLTVIRSARKLDTWSDRRSDALSIKFGFRTFDC